MNDVKTYQIINELTRRSLSLKDLSDLLDTYDYPKILSILCSIMKKYLQDVLTEKSTLFAENFKKTFFLVLSNCNQANFGGLLKKIQELENRCRKQEGLMQAEILSNLEEIEKKIVEQLDSQYVDNHYDFISYLVYEVKSLTYLRQVLAAKPYYVNAKNEDGKHIIFELIDKYIKEFRIKGNSKKLSYYSNAIFIFLNASRFHLSKKEIEEYKKIIRFHLIELEEQQVSSRTAGFYKELLSILDKKQMDQEQIEDINNEFGIRLGFSFDVQTEIKSLPQKPYIITIDDVSTLDMDDAVSITKEEDYYRLHIYISDVASVIKSGSAIDREAYKRMETLYFSNPAIPMIPVELSNQILSLNTSGYKPVIEVTIDIYENGDISRPNISRNHILVSRKCSYEEVNRIVQEGTSNKRLEKTIQYLNEAASILSKQNDRSVYREIKDIKNSTQGIERHKAKYTDRTKAEIIIEEIMVLFNSEIARFFAEKGYPCLYRVHPTPTITKEYTSLLRLKELVAENYENGKDYTKLANTLLNMYPQAYYSIFNIGHSGLNKDYYCHATSPIRRYPDIILQRLIYDYVFSEPVRSKDQFWIPTLTEMCKYCNERMDENIQYQIRMQYVRPK